MREKENNQTPLLLRIGGDFFIKLFCRWHFTVEGKENIARMKEKNPEGKFIIVSSHFCNLDAPAAIKTLGKEFDLQIAVESVLFNSIPHLALFLLGGKKNFSPLSYRHVKKGKEGIFHPEDFAELARKMEWGKTPWIVIHPFTIDGQMKRARIGPVYFAQKTKAQIIPVALEVHGASVNLEGIIGWLKGLFGGMRAKYHIDKTISLEPVDISIIERVFDKRNKREAVTASERKALKEVHSQLTRQADQVAETISKMLPEEQRGFYRRKGRS